MDRLTYMALSAVPGHYVIGLLRGDEIVELWAAEAAVKLEHAGARLIAKLAAPPGGGPR